MTDNILEVKEMDDEKPAVETAVVDPSPEVEPVQEVETGGEKQEVDKETKLLALHILQQMAAEREAAESKTCGFCTAHKWLDLFLKSAFVLIVLAGAFHLIKAEKK